MALFAFILITVVALRQPTLLRNVLAFIFVSALIAALIVGTVALGETYAKSAKNPEVRYRYIRP